MNRSADDNPDQCEVNWHVAAMTWSHFDAETNLRLVCGAGFQIDWHEVEDMTGKRHLFVLASITPEAVSNSSPAWVVYPCIMHTRLILPLTLALFAFGALAQTPKPKPAPQEAKLPGIVPNPKWTINQNSAQLLLNQDVQRDMALSPGTKGALLKVYGAYQTRYTALTAGKQEGTDELAAKLDEAMLDAANQAVSALSQAESARLRQIGVRSMGLDALRMPEVLKGLALSADQKARLDAMFTAIDEKQSSLDAALGDRLSKLTDPGPNATPEQQAAYQKATQAVLDDLAPQGHALDDQKKTAWEAFYASLTADQKAAWRALRGKPVMAAAR